MVGNGLAVCPLAAVIVDKDARATSEVVEMARWGGRELGKLAKGD
jgi:hypothetical protein